MSKLAEEDAKIIYQGTDKMTTGTGHLLFPEEVWEIIFGKVADPKDLWSCSNAYPVFHDILEKWRLRYLLEEALPYFYWHLPKAKILECRTICKSWKLGMDNFLEDHPSLRPLGKKGDGKSDPRKLDFVNPLKQKEFGIWWKCFCFSELANNTILGNPKFPDMPGCNPFIGRLVVLFSDVYCGGFGPEALLIWTKVDEFLKRFGKEIWYLDLSVLEPGDSEKQRTRQLITADLFNFAPNLRKLRLTDINWRSEVDGIITPEEFPPAPNLETIESGEPIKAEGEDAILAALLKRYHNQLGKVCLSVDTWKAGAQLLGWPALTELHLNQIRKPDDIIGNLYGVEMPHLRRLGLNLRYANKKFTFAHVANVIREFLSLCPKLETIRLEGVLFLRNDLKGEISYGTTPEGNDCTVPASLKTLEVEHFLNNTLSYNLLLDYFPHLENLNVYSRGNPYYWDMDNAADIDLCTESYYYDDDNAWSLAIKDDWKREQAVELNKYAFGGNMYRSNIWEVMPHLKVLTFQWDVFTRGGYEDYLAKRVGAGTVAPEGK